MEEENTIIVDFEDLTSELQDDAIQYEQKDEYLVPDNWYEWVIEDLAIKYKDQGYEIDDESLSFDLYRNELEYKGEVDINNKNIEKYMSEKLLKYMEDEWIYDMDLTIDSKEVYDPSNYYVNDEIETQIEQDFFGEDTDKIELYDNEAHIPIEVKSQVEKGIKEWEARNLEIDFSYPKQVINLIETASLFFSEEAITPEDDYTNFIKEVFTVVENDIDKEWADFTEKVNEDLDKIWHEIKDALQSDYDGYYDEDNIKQSLIDREIQYEVEVDEEGNQLEIIEYNV